MPTIWEYIHLSRSDSSNSSSYPQHNLQEGLLQIASQTCNILVQVNNTNNFGDNATNIQYNNFPTKPSCSRSGGSTSTAKDRDDDIPNASSSSTNNRKKTSFDLEEQSVVLLHSNDGEPRTKDSNAKNLFTSYKHRLSTVLEGSTTPGGDDDFELWDQSQMLRSEHGTVYKWGHKGWCKPSCIPITVILILIVLVVLLPLLDHPHDKSSSSKNNHSLHSSTCNSMCSIQLVESIPDGLIYPDDSPSFMSTFESWETLISLANKKIEIASFYWTLRGADVYNHSSAWQGEKIFQSLLTAGLDRNIKIKIAQSAPTQSAPNLDTEIFVKRKAAEVRSVNFPRLLGGGVLHTKLWIIDRTHFYIGSANMDWRALTQVKEMGVLVRNCSCLANDVAKIFDVYWDMGTDNAQIPSKWPDRYATKINQESPIKVNFNEEDNFLTYFSSSPPRMSPKGRTQDLDAITNVILSAEKFVHIAVMDYFPLTLYTPKLQFWPFIDDAIRKAAIENKVTVKLLISLWNHSRPNEEYFLRSLEVLSNSYKGVDIQIKRFVVPATADQSKIPFGRVNHNKYMVTDITAFIGTSNWSGDYFIDTAGIGLVMQDSLHERMANDTTIRSNLASVFERDWNSKYAIDF